MKRTLAFDVYGTLIDTSGVYQTLENSVGKDAQTFMDTWRNKQLEYSFRRGLMNAFVDFSVVTREALDYCCLLFDKTLNPTEIRDLMDAYKVLPAFDDVESALKGLSDVDFSKYAFSNGSARAVSSLLENANITHLFDGVVSVEKTRMFKPSPLVYQHFNSETNSEKENTWLISGNPFDVMGAINYGMKGVWVRRFPKTVFDPWEIEPTVIISDLKELKKVF